MKTVQPPGESWMFAAWMSTAKRFPITSVAMCRLRHLYINLSNGDLIIFPLNNQFEIVNELRIRQKNPKVCDIIIRSPQKTVEKKRSFLFRSPLADGILAAAKKMRIYAIVNPSEFCDMLKNNAKQVGQGVTVPSFRA